MPARKLIAEKLAQTLSALSHPDRFRIIGELRAQERDVESLTRLLDLPQSTVSQHLAILYSRNFLKRRRQGRRVYYSLTHAWVAKWLMEGLKLLELEEKQSPELIAATQKVRQIWMQDSN